tara:strand:+ start:786 stop:1178 length:393 start_codon:yes stop_codon:yes gene_type:complete
MKINTDIIIDKEMLLRHFPQHTEEDVQEALKTSKIEMLYGLLQWTSLAKNRQIQLDEALQRVETVEARHKREVERYDKLYEHHHYHDTIHDRKFEFIWHNILSDEDREFLVEEFKDSHYNEVNSKGTIKF